MTGAEISRALAIREVLLEDHNEELVAEIVANNSVLLARIIEYYCASWQEVEAFTVALRVVTGSAP